MAIAMTYNVKATAECGKEIEIKNVPEWVVAYGRYITLHPNDAKNLHDWAEETGRYELAKKQK